MNRYQKDRTQSVKPHRVTRVELSDRNVALRLGLAIAFLLVGITTLVLTFLHYVGTESGWQEITVNSDAELGCSQDFTLYYELGTGSQNARVEKQALSGLYGTLCTKAYRLFNNDSTFEGMNNLRAINDNPNTVLTVEPELYAAFAALDEAECRYLFYAPVFQLLENLCTAESDTAAAETDPETNPELQAYAAEVLQLVRNPEDISLELLGDNQVCLRISAAYAAFAQQEQLTDFLDFYALRNSFEIDLIADGLIAAGYTAGTISGNDGCARSLDGGESPLSFTVYDCSAGTVYAAAEAEVSGIDSIVPLRSFPLTEADMEKYYVYRGGETRTPYLDPETGSCRAAVSSLTGCAASGSCGETAALLVQTFTGETLTEAELNGLQQAGISTIYCETENICSNVPGAVFTELYSGGGITYTVKAS